MEFSGTKEQILNKLKTIPDGNYDLIIVKSRTRNLNRIHGAIRRAAKQNDTTFEVMKEKVKRELGFFYEEEVFVDGEPISQKVYLSFTMLTDYQFELLTIYCDGL